jgi:hypothetical protein
MRTCVAANHRLPLKWDVVIINGVTFMCVARKSALTHASRFRQELDTVRQDLVLAPFLSLLALPGAILQAAFDEDRATLVQVLTTALGLLAKDDDVDKAGIIAPLVPLFDTIIDRQSESGYWGPGGGIAHFGVSSEIAQEYDTV